MNKMPLKPKLNLIYSIQKIQYLSKLNGELIVYKLLDCILKIAIFISNDRTTLLGGSSFWDLFLNVSTKKERVSKLIIIQN